MNARQQAQLWATNPYFDPDTRQKAQEAQGDAEALLAAFGSHLSFGTGGLRGVLGTGTARMNIYTVGRATLGLARYLKHLSPEPSVVIAHDSRHGAEAFTAVTAGVLASLGIRAHVFPELAPTPMLSFAVRMLHADAGVMITASHNPAVYNGYKVYGPDGCQITDQAGADITAQIEQCAYTDPRPLTEEDARRNGLWLEVADALRRSFAQACLFCRPDPELSAPIRVVYTPLNGTGLKPVEEVLSPMQGVSISKVEAQCPPDGDFPTCPKPNPELDETLQLGLAQAAEEEADLLLATDPDCDRVGVAVRTPDGAYKRLSGNEVGLLMMQYMLEARKRQNLLSSKSTVVKTIVTSDLAFAMAKDYGVQVREVLTGFKYIGEVISQLEAAGRENGYVFGFEESCGYLPGTHVRDKDGVSACMLVCEMAQRCKADGITLWDALQRLYRRYGYLGTRLMDFEIGGALPMEEMRATMARLRQHPLMQLAGHAVTGAKDYQPGLDGLPPSNVLAFTAGPVKAIVRPSGTEPKVKVYLSALADSAPEADALLDALETDIHAALRS